MTFFFTYYALNGDHITFNRDGSIELTTKDGHVIVLEYLQARILKKMVIAQHDLENCQK